MKISCDFTTRVLARNPPLTQNCVSVSMGLHAFLLLGNIAVADWPSRIGADEPKINYCRVGANLTLLCGKKISRVESAPTLSARVFCSFPLFFGRWAGPLLRRRCLIVFQSWQAPTLRMHLTSFLLWDAANHRKTRALSTAELPTPLQQKLITEPVYGAATATVHGFVHDCGFKFRRRPSSHLGPWLSSASSCRPSPWLF